jgi:GAT domain
MLCRILTDNPGRPFTQNFDDKYVSTTKQLLRDGKDQSVQQILRETLDYFEAEKAPANDSLGTLIQMWRKEKAKGARFPPGPVVSRASDVFVPTYTGTDEAASQYPMHVPNQSRHPPRPPRGLPPPDELAARIEEAKTTARLLIQTVQSTPQSELIGNELVKEFADRSRAAHKSIQAYMNCDNPSPDEDTMLTLIETNDQLNVAMSKHQRALLQARKAAGLTTPSPQPAAGQEPSSYMMPQHMQGQNVYANVTSPQLPSRDPYSSSPPRSPPRRNGNMPAPALPPREEQSFSPPAGPPPSQLAQPQSTHYEYEDAYSAPPQPPQSPPRDRTEQQPFSPVSPIDSRSPQTTSTAAYGVPENPFADDAYAAEPQQPKTYTLFDRAQHHISQPPPPDPGQEPRK